MQMLVCLCFRSTQMADPQREIRPDVDENSPLAGRQHRSSLGEGRLPCSDGGRQRVALDVSVVEEKRCSEETGEHTGLRIGAADSLNDRVGRQSRL